MKSAGRRPVAVAAGAGRHVDVKISGSSSLSDQQMLVSLLRDLSTSSMRSRKCTIPAVLFRRGLTPPGPPWPKLRGRARRPLSNQSLPSHRAHALASQCCTRLSEHERLIDERRFSKEPGGSWHLTELRRPSRPWRLPTEQHCAQARVRAAQSHTRRQGISRKGCPRTSSRKDLPMPLCPASIR